MQPGESIKRVDLHAEFGGGGQGGISPSRRSPNIFLFADPDSGLQHGYVDGWKNDGLYDYTGEGQRGDQAFSRGNSAIRDHVEERRALRVFEGTGGIVSYLGEFKLDESQPYYRTDAPETNDGPLRSVIVFRLRPVDSIPKETDLDLKPAAQTVVRTVSIEQRYTEGYVTNPSAAPLEADRREALLVHNFRDHMWASQNVSAARHEITPEGEVKPLYTDLYFESLNLLVEAKGTIERGAFRMAIGQLADYKRYLNNPRCAILLPDRPRADLLSLAAAERIIVIWATQKAFHASEELLSPRDS